MSGERTVHFVMPDGVDDLMRPSGGNTYDRRLRQALPARGWSVRTSPVAGAWPCPDPAARRSLRGVLAELPSGSVVLLDGLVGTAAPDVVVPEARRLRLVVLLHMPLGPGAGEDVARGERDVLRTARAVVTPSRWSRDWVRTTYRLDPRRLHVAEPGVDPADPAAGSADGGRLLCVAAVVPGKGHDLLVDALARVADLPWRCTCVGDLGRAPAFVEQVRRRIGEAGLSARIRLAGPRTGADLVGSYLASDLLVLASRAETYGMVVTEALAHGVPVLATDVGGVAEALGASSTGDRPGVLTPAGDVPALAGALRSWLQHPALRRQLRSAAGDRRPLLAGWSDTADRVATVLERAS